MVIIVTGSHEHIVLKGEVGLSCQFSHARRKYETFLICSVVTRAQIQGFGKVSEFISWLIFLFELNNFGGQGGLPGRCVDANTNVIRASETFQVLF